MHLYMLILAAHHTKFSNHPLNPSSVDTSHRQQCAFLGDIELRFALVKEPVSYFKISHSIYCLSTSMLRY